MTQLSRGWTVCGPTEYPKGIEFCLSNWQARQNATLVATVSATKTRGLTVLSGTGWGRGVSLGKAYCEQKQGFWLLPCGLYRGQDRVLDPLYQLSTAP